MHARRSSGDAVRKSKAAEFFALYDEFIAAREANARARARSSPGLPYVEIVSFDTFVRWLSLQKETRSGV
jgi:hypothetical protein